ncbi:Dyslexia susceptibility 1 candidate protein [Phytophthora cinnamomi]|uniref:Dyslexia susceptibility 1 candidate protein n=1 Tax=Phytophthora cinnamomi TaxID=4785 RepID=UPI00355984C0|nr:Dyslexia susceptibility 1 candidate protein [Phytophthora cinnamomi]
MPLAPRYTWEEDASNLALELHLPGKVLRNTDVYVSDLVVKVNAAPYVLLLDLQDFVDDSSAVVKSLPTSSLLRISLKKKEERVWKELQYRDTKTALRERRDASMERKRASETALSEKRKERRYQEEKDTLRAQMAVDDTNRQILTDLKAEEKEREERSLYESFRDLQVQKQEQKKKAANNQDAQTQESIASIKQGVPLPSTEKTKKNVSFATLPRDNLPSIRDNQEDEVIELTEDGSFDISNVAKLTAQQTTYSAATPEDSPGTEPNDWVQVSRHEAIEVEDDIDPPTQTAELPPPREYIKSEIRFTPRVFPTPSRESKAAEEEDWLLKNRKHISKHQGLNRTSEYDISETDPIWLKAKGDDFFHSKDFRSATNAYAEAISATASDNIDLIAACLSNRAACLLQLGGFEECISDCSKALSYLPDSRDTDKTSSALKHYRLKLKLFVRRGTAYCRVGQYTQAKADYGVACSMDTQNPQLRDDFMELVAMEKAHELKVAGDDIFRQGNDLEQAIRKYSDSLQLNPLSIACLSNRAACYLMQHAGKECVEDCTRALELLQQDATLIGNSSQEHGLAFFSIGPAAGSIQRRAWVVKTLVRRGAAYLSLRELDRAEQDYTASVELDPTNEALKADLVKVRNERGRRDVQYEEPIRTCLQG